MQNAMTYQTEEDKARFKRVKTEQAIQFAMQSRWDEAIAANRAIIGAFPNEVDAYNRLGKALSEAGKIKDARAAYQKALELSPSNSIAKKNLERLASVRAKAEPDKALQVNASLFIEEMGKTGVTTVKPANRKMLATLSAGDEVALKTIGSRLTLETAGGDYISDVEPKLAVRLTRLMEGGNKYAAAVASLSGDNVRVIIKETFQHPTQAGKLSFPAGKAGEVIRPYIKGSLMRVTEEEEYFEEGEEWEEGESAEAEHESEGEEGFSTEGGDEEDEEEEFEE